MDKDQIKSAKKTIYAYWRMKYALEQATIEFEKEKDDKQVRINQSVIDMMKASIEKREHNDVCKLMDKYGINDITDIMSEYHDMAHNKITQEFEPTTENSKTK